MRVGTGRGTWHWDTSDKAAALVQVCSGVAWTRAGLQRRLWDDRKMEDNCSRLV